MAYNKVNPNGSATSANSSPVVIASDQATVPVSLASVPSHAVTNAGTFATQATLTAETTKVIGVVRTADGAGNLTTSTSNALDINIKSGNPTSITANLGTLNGAAQDGTDITTPTAMPAGGAGIRGWLSAIWTKLNGSIAVTGTFWQATQPISGTVTVNALPAGTNVIGHVIADSGSTTAVTGTVTVSGTVTTTPPSNASTNIAQINGVTPLMGNGVTGTGSQRVTIASDNTAFSVNAAATQSGTWTVQPGNTANTTAWKVDGSAVTQPVSLASVPSHAVTNAGTFAVQAAAAGDVAAGASDSGNPVKIGAIAKSSEPTALTTAQRAQLYTDLVGKLIVLPYANPENFVSGVTAAMTGTTSTSLIAAPAAGLRNYITHIIVTNSHATVGTFVVIQDGSGGTTLYEGYAAAAGGGFSITFPTPLRQPTTATAIYCADVTTGANVIVSASGYKGA